MFPVQIFPGCEKYSRLHDFPGGPVASVSPVSRRWFPVGRLSRLPGSVFFPAARLFFFPGSPGWVVFPMLSPFGMTAESVCRSSSCRVEIDLRPTNMPLLIGSGSVLGTAST